MNDNLGLSTAFFKEHLIFWAFVAIYWPCVRMNRTVEAITNLLLYWSNFDKGIKILSMEKFLHVD